MIVQDSVNAYLSSQPEPKRADLVKLHEMIMDANPDCRLWYFDGKNDEGKVVANPTIGYGSTTIIHADGTRKDTFTIGLSGNKSGISVYVLGLKDKKVLSEKFGAQLGKASVTGYCIKFRGLREINPDVLLQAIQFGLRAPAEGDQS